MSSNFCRSSVLSSGFRSTALLTSASVSSCLLTKRLGLNTGCGNTLFDQEALGAVDTPFGKRLIVFHGTARVGMAFKSQASIRLALEIGLEIASERNKSLLLTGKQAAIGILRRGLGGCKIDTVQGEPLFDRAGLCAVLAAVALAR